MSMNSTRGAQPNPIPELSHAPLTFKCKKWENTSKAFKSFTMHCMEKNTLISCGNRLGACHTRSKKGER